MNFKNPNVRLAIFVAAAVVLFVIAGVAVLLGAIMDVVLIIGVLPLSALVWFGSAWIAEVDGSNNG